MTTTTMTTGAGAAVLAFRFTPVMTTTTARALGMSAVPAAFLLRPVLMAA